MHNFFQRLAPAVALCLPLLAAAQAPRNDASSVDAAAPPLRYQSAFGDYKPWQDIKPSDWRSANDTVRDASKGGHAGHTMGAPAAQTGAASAPAGSASAPAVKPAAPGEMPGHSGHQMQEGKQ